MRRNDEMVSLKKMVVATIVAMAAAMFMYSCSGGDSNESTASKSDNVATASSGTFDTLSDKGIGPVTSVSEGAINSDSATKGESLFKTKCSACHKLDERLVGPALKGVTKRRTPEWVMNQILNPAEQIEKDPIGKALLAKYMTQMTFQNVTQTDARDILEYFRSIDAK